jgi:hypothetical protein
VVQPSEPDVVGPAVTADDPHARGDQRVGDRRQVLHAGVLTQLREPGPQGFDPRPLGVDLDVVRGQRSLEQPEHQRGIEPILERGEERPRQVAFGIDRQPHPQPELRVVLEQ